jgi:hypothetical protein
VKQVFQFASIFTSVEALSPSVDTDEKPGGNNIRVSDSHHEEPLVPSGNGRASFASTGIEPNDARIAKVTLQLPTTESKEPWNDSPPYSPRTVVLLQLCV